MWAIAKTVGGTGTKIVGVVRHNGGLAFADEIQGFAGYV
jgi:hypothetical protein